MYDAITCILLPVSMQESACGALSFYYYCFNFTINIVLGMSQALNQTQLEILKMMNFIKDEKQLSEIKSLLVAYLSDKVVSSADKDFDQRQYTAEIFEKWKTEHFRKSA